MIVKISFEVSSSLGPNKQSKEEMIANVASWIRIQNRHDRDRINNTQLIAQDDFEIIEKHSA